MERSEVYKLIDGEREYQDRLGSDRTDFQKHTVGDYLTMIGHYYNRAVEDWTMKSGNLQALDEIRKIAAICVRCMEEWDAPPRDTEP